jgi:hypothetical protein
MIHNKEERKHYSKNPNPRYSLFLAVFFMEKVAHTQDETDRKIRHRPKEALEIDLGLILRNLLIAFCE